MNRIVLRLCLYLTFTYKISATSNWILNDEGQCFYTMISTNPSQIDPVQISTCDYSDPYITLIISNNTETNITSDFLNVTFNSWVYILKAVDNNWTSISPLTFSNFKNIGYVDLSGNHIKNVDMAFKGLQALDFLNLSRNNIEEIYPETFMTTVNSRLNLLDLSYNLLTHLSSDLFANLYSLRMLYLQGNKISKLGDDCFRNLKNLIYLNLCCDNISNIDNSSIKYLNYLNDLDLSENNIT